MSATPYEFVEVDWLDSQSTAGWQSIHAAVRSAADDDLVHHSCGYLLVDHDDYVLLMGSTRNEREADAAMCADVMQIPRVAVLDVRVLTERKQRR